MSLAGHNAHGTRGSLHGIAVTYLRSDDGATAIVADHGAHLLSWCPAGAGETLFLSAASGFAAGQAIRGGVPIIFPQFGTSGPGRRHGVARLQGWQYLGAEIEAGVAVVRLALHGRFEEPQSAQPAASYSLHYAIRLQGSGIELVLTIENPSLTPWQCQAALHTYLRVDHLAAAVVQGLQGCRYIDQAADAADDCLQDSTLAFTAEIDRIYPQAPSPLALHDGSRTVCVQQQGFVDTVIWNPGAVKAAALHDLVPCGEQQFVCIEAARLMPPLLLAPGMRWQASQRLWLQDTKSSE